MFDLTGERKRFEVGQALRGMTRSVVVFGKVGLNFVIFVTFGLGYGARWRMLCYVFPAFIFFFIKFVQ